jgi:hypothetical protein
LHNCIGKILLERCGKFLRLPATVHQIDLEI